MASSEQLKLIIDVSTKNATKALGDLKKSVKDTGEAFDDTRSDVDRLVDELNSAADQMAADLKSAGAAADALGHALGPELQAKIGDAKIDAFVADLQRAGLTFKDVEENADRFADSLRRMDAASDGVKNVDTKLHNMNATGDNSRSVLANLVGNSAQDLGELSGIAGTAGVALGQLAEYAADGNISLAGLAGFIGPMAGLAVGVGAITKALQASSERAAQAQALMDKLVAAFDDARESGTTTAQQIAKSWKEGSGKVEVAMTMMDRAFWTNWQRQKDGLGQMQQNWDDTSQEIVDMNDVLLSLNMSAEDFLQIAASSPQEIGKFGDALIQNGVDADTTAKIVNGLYAQHQNLAEAEKVSAARAQIFGDKTKDAGDAAKTAAGHVKTLTDRYGVLLDKLNDEDAYDSAIDSFDSVQQAAQDYWDAAAKGADDAEAKQRDYQRTIRDSQRETITYADQLGNVPESVVTHVLMLIDEGKFAEAQAEIDRWAKTPAYKQVIVTVGGAQVPLAGGNSPSGVTPSGQRVATQDRTTINVYPRTMPTQRELIDMNRSTLRRQGTTGN